MKRILRALRRTVRSAECNTSSSDLALNVGNRILYLHVEDAFAQLRRRRPRVAHNAILSVASGELVLAHVGVPPRYISSDVSGIPAWVETGRRFCSAIR